MSMLRNYVTVAWRNLTNHKLYSAINIGGLAVGLAACLLILLFVRDELSYETWVPNAERIAIVETTFNVPGRDKLAFAGVPGPTKAKLDKDFSSDIERMVRVYDDELPSRAGDRQFLQRVSYIDPGFFEVWDLPMAAGERESVLAGNASIILSETTAKKFFGDEAPLGKTITVGKYDYNVAGVFKDLPKNTHLRMQAIALFDGERYKDQPWVAEQWTSVNMQGYVLFRSVESRARVAADMPAFLDRNVNFEMPGITEKPSTLMEMDFLPILDIHLHADKPGYANVGDMTAVIAFSGIALLILVIACINFVNLATARATKRAREVAMRKVVGSTRAQLIVQHLGEAVFTALIALVIAIALVEALLGPFNGFTHKELRFDLIRDPTLLLMTVGLIVVVGAIGGLYPAIYLSRFRPAQVLKANQSSASGSSLLRSGLVVFQFATSIALIACTATIYGQTVYARTLDLGFAKENRLSIGNIGELTSSGAATFKRQVAALPGVTGVSLSSDTPPLKSNNNSLLFPTPVPGEIKLVIETLRVDPDFFTVYGVKPLAGRLFSADRTTDFQPDKDHLGPDPKQSIVINMDFARKLGATRPEEVLGKTLYDVADDKNPVMIATTVIGVVPDLYFRSVRIGVTPLMYYVRGAEGSVDQDARDWSYLTASVTPGRMKETQDKIRELWSALAPTVPIRTHFIDEDLAAQYDADAQRGHIFAGFALLAVLIACLGLFGLASFSAERRTKEIGMRKVLGASVMDIVRLLVWQFSRPVLLANVIAWPISFYLMHRWLSGFRYALDLSDPRWVLGIFGGAGVLALAIAWLTIAGHAYKVARANPGRALRVE